MKKSIFLIILFICNLNTLYAIDTPRRQGAIDSVTTNNDLNLNAPSGIGLSSSEEELLRGVNGPNRLMNAATQLSRQAPARRLGAELRNAGVPRARINELLHCTLTGGVRYTQQRSCLERENFDLNTPYVRHALASARKMNIVTHLLAEECHRLYPSQSGRCDERLDVLVRRMTQRLLAGYRNSPRSNRRNRDEQAANATGSPDGNEEGNDDETRLGNGDRVLPGSLFFDSEEGELPNINTCIQQESLNDQVICPQRLEEGELFFASEVEQLLQRGEQNSFLDLLRLEHIGEVIRAYKIQFGAQASDLSIPSSCNRISGGIQRLLDAPMNNSDRAESGQIHSEDYHSRAKEVVRRMGEEDLANCRQQYSELGRIRREIGEIRRARRDDLNSRTQIDETSLSQREAQAARLVAQIRDQEARLAFAIRGYRNLAVGHDFSTHLCSQNSLPYLDQFRAALERPRAWERLDQRTNRIMKNEVEQNLANLCDQTEFPWNRIMQSEALRNRLVARYPQYRAIDHCLKQRADTHDSARTAGRIVGGLSCGVGAGVVGMASGGAGFTLGALCGVGSVFLAHSEVDEANNELAWMGECYFYHGADSDLCSSEDYLRARRGAREAQEKFAAEIGFLVGFDLLMPAIGSALGRLSPDKLDDVAEILRRAAPSDSSASSIPSIVDDTMDVLLEGRRLSDENLRRIFNLGPNDPITDEMRMIADQNLLSAVNRGDITNDEFLEAIDAVTRGCRR